MKTNHKFKVGDKVRFISKDSFNAKYFKCPIDNLKIKQLIEENNYYIYDSVVDCDWFVTGEELELIPETYKYEVVHTETQEQWDFVLSKLTPGCSLNKQSKDFTGNKSLYPEGIGVSFSDNSWGGINYFKQENSKIYLFKEWLDKFGHKSEYLKQNQQLDKFPNEGHCKSLDKDLINYLIETRGTTDTKGSKDRSEGVGWNYTSYWYLRDCNNSNKPKYELEQLSKFFNKKQEQWIPQVGDYVITEGYSDRYDGRILQINKIDPNRYYYFEVFDKGYYNKNHNFNKKSISRKALPHEIPTQELSKEDLLAEAKRRYPVGTKYWNLNRAGGKSVPSNTIEKLPVIGKNWKFEIADTDSIDGTDIIVVRDKEGMTHGWVYAKNTWAEIVEEPKIKSNKTVFDIEGYQQSDWSQVLHSTGKIIFEDGCAVKLVKNNKILPIKVRNGNITELTELPKRTRIKIIKKQLLTI